VKRMRIKIALTTLAAAALALAGGHWPFGP
jgi:hypothetical protein